MTTPEKELAQQLIHQAKNQGINLTNDTLLTELTQTSSKPPWKKNSPTTVTKTHPISKRRKWRERPQRLPHQNRPHRHRRTCTNSSTTRPRRNFRPGHRP